MEPGVIEYPSVRFAYVLRTCKVEELPTLIPADLTTVGAAAGKRTAGPPRVYYDAWQDSGGGNVWIGFPVTDEFEAQGDIKVEAIEGGRAVMAVHDGPYNEMRVAWDAAIAFMQKEGICKGRFSWEDYVDPKPITHICLEVAG